MKSTTQLWQRACGATLALVGLCILSLGPALADDPPWSDAPPASKPGQPAQPAPPADDPAPPADPAPEPDAPPPAKEIDPKNAPKCVVTGDRWDTSSTRVEAILKVDGEKKRGKFLGLQYMLIEYKLLKADHHTVDIQSVSVVDFASVGTGSERMIMINDDWSNVAFLYTQKKLPGSRSPGYAAFSDAEELQKAQKVIGGKPVTYKNALTQIFRALDAPDEPNGKRKS